MAGLRTPTRSFDKRLSARLALPAGARSRRWAALLLAHSGDSLLWLSAAAVALLLGGPAWRPFAVRAIATTIAAGSVATLLKWAFRRERPPGEGRGFYTRFDRPAFPSGHAARSSCLVLLLAPLLLPWSWPLLLLWVILVGLARVALEVHFVSDIVGGWIAGLVVGAALIVLL